MRSEITIDDVIEFIIKNCDNVELMDKINKTSFPFTTKYLNSNKWGEKKSTPDYSPYTWHNGTVTLCSNEALSSNKE